MISARRIIHLLVLGCQLLLAAYGFVHVPSTQLRQQQQCIQRQRLVLSRRQVSLTNHTTIAADQSTTSNNGDSSSNCNNPSFLTFQSSFEATSNALPSTCADLKTFFDDPSHFAFGKELPTEIVPMTEELLQEWTEACREVGATLPTSNNDNDDNILLSVRAAGISMLGLTLEWSALMGAKVVIEGNGEDPFLEFVLIRDQSEARGRNRALLWIYNKIMNAKSSKTKRRETRFLTRFGFQKMNGKLQFHCAGTMEMLLPIPGAARRMMGYSSDSAKIRKVEAKVNKLITSEIEKDMAKAVSHWEDNFQAWVEKQQYKQ